MTQVHPWQSIRTRIAVVVAAVTVAVLAISGTVVVNQTLDASRERLREQALDRLTSAVTLFDSALRLPSGASSDPGLVPHQLGTAIDQAGARGTWFDGDQMWAAQRISPTEVISVQVDGAPLRAERASLLGSVLVGLALALLVAGILGWLAAVGLSRRLRQAAALAAIRSDPAAPAQSIRDAVGGYDEISALSEAIDTMAAELEDRIARERQFGANVAHELRTPLTALVSSAELLPADEATSLVRNQIDRMRRLVEDLLELFRVQGAQVPGEMEDVDLGTAVENVLKLAPGLGPVALTVESSSRVRLDRRRLARIVVNLVSNAHLHGARDGQATQVAMSVRGRLLEVSDDGPGYPEELVREGPSPFRRYSEQPGSGLGLALVARQAALMDAEFTLANDNGAKAVVTFAPSQS